MAVITIDGNKHEVDGKQNLLHVCLSLGYNLPYFCWHPAMGSVGACRQCAVIKYKDENDDKGKLVMACMEPASDGSIISLKNPEAAGFRAEIIEWLMTNHPHDCPVCDEGGECHLQDMTVMTGHDYRRFRFKKRTYRNQYLGPFVNHEMNRCIQCYRCVRFYRDYADGRDLDAFAAHNHVFFGRHEDGILENEFSGNLVEVCPTGVFTDKTLKQHYTRKWDLTTAPSICVHCSVGCNTIAGERYGSLRRILSRYNSQVNGYFLCDRGRFGYEFVNSSKRIKNASIRTDSHKEMVDLETAISHVRDLVEGEPTVIGIGSPRASLEANYLLKKFVGEDNFYSGVSPEQYRLQKIQLDVMKSGAFHSPSLHDIEQSDAVLILGEDITNTAPMLALSVRQAIKQAPPGLLAKLKIPEWQDAAVREAVQEEKLPLFIASSYSTKLDDVSALSINLAPGDVARIGNAIASSFDNSIVAPDDLTDKEKEFVGQAAEALRQAEKPLIITGTCSFSEDIIYSAVNAAISLQNLNKNLSLSFIFPHTNSAGLMLLGGKPLDLVDGNKRKVIINLKNDLMDVEAELFRKMTDQSKLITVDCLENETTERSDIVIPAGTFAESDGTFINNEGRAQRYYQVYEPANKEIMESWRIMSHLLSSASQLASADSLAELSGSESASRDKRTSEETQLINEETIKKNEVISGQAMAAKSVYEDVLEEMAAVVPGLKSIVSITPPPGFRIVGQKIPREPHRFSGRTAMHADVNVSEPKPPVDPDSPLSFTMEGYRGEPPSSMIPFFWYPGWNSVQSINKYQIEVGGPLHGGDPGRRLFERNDSSNMEYYNISLKKFVQKDGAYLAVPVYHIFGSEELSSQSPAVQQLIPELSIWMNPDDAAGESITDNENVEITSGETSYKMPVKIVKYFPRGMIGFPVLPGKTLLHSDPAEKVKPEIKYNEWLKVKKNAD